MIEANCKYCDNEFEIKDDDENGENCCTPDCESAFRDADERVKAYAEFADVPVNEAEASQDSHDEQRFTDGRREYLVVTDDEADELWDQDLDNYIEECILHELPEQYRSYFDDERWKSDARIDGRAHSLNRYDGTEDEANGYYIYRQN